MLYLWTDGGCWPNPGPGGWAAILVAGNNILKEVFGFEERTTNNRMEFLAVIRGLELTQEHSYITVITDSEYIANSLKQRKTKKNRDLIERLRTLCLRRHVSFKTVLGHTGIYFNERADMLAFQARKRHIGSNSLAVHRSNEHADEDETKADCVVADVTQRQEVASPHGVISIAK